MGCHTWFYKKIENISDDNVRKTVIKGIQSELDFLDKLINDRNSLDKKLLESYPEWTPGYAKENITHWNKVMDSVKNNTIDKEELYDYYCDWDSDLIDFVEGRGWYKQTEYHDIFRKYGYPEDKLFSLEETLSYINNTENNCDVYDYTNEKLKEFWNKYPDGMIYFG